MEIQKALPQKKYLDALQHSRTPEFKAIRDKAIFEIRSWVKDPRVNKSLPPAVHGGGGKDSCACAILMGLAGVPRWAYVSIINGGDLPTHQAFLSEFDQWLGLEQVCDRIEYRTEKRMVEVMKEVRDWGQLNKVKNKSGELVNYWDLGPLDKWVNEEIGGKFSSRYDAGFENVLQITGNRGSEEMWKHFEFERRGFRKLFQINRGDKKNPNPYWAGEPLMEWRDRDVWALLISEGAPCSPIYSYHQVPQRGGKNAFPRTLWYPSEIMMNEKYYKWMATYAPALLKEMLDFFPEIEHKLKIRKTA